MTDLQKKILALRRQGYGPKEVAMILGCSKGYANKTFQDHERATLEEYHRRKEAVNA